MYTRGRGLKLTAVSAMVVLTLTGFSSGHGHGRRGHHSDGGGCSSSSQDHDASSTSGGSGGSSGGDPYGGSTSGSGSDDTYGSGTTTGTSGGSTHRTRPTRRTTPTASPTGDSARPLEDGTAVLVHCASADDPYATVEVRNPNGRQGLFTVKIGFKDAQGSALFETSDQVSVPANDKATVRVPVASAGRVEEIEHCEVAPRAAAVR
ncbi:hypothetical protein [Streptomyces aureus]|uniref:hypothetical protein n=1 Tax=Streptomyces aureus TaxID=193461 RepID=UPI0033DAB2D2